MIQTERNADSTLSIRRKLFLLRIGIGMVMGLAIGLCSVITSGLVLYSSTKKDLTASVIMARNQAAATVDLLSNRVADIAGSKDIEKYFQTDREIVLYKLFASVSDPFQHLVYLDTTGTPQVTFINGRLAENRSEPDRSPEFLSALKHPKKSFIQGPRWDADLEQFVLTFYHHHKDYFENPYGILKACIPLEKMAEYFERVFKAETRHTVLIAGDRNRLIYWTKHEDLGRPLPEVIGSSAPLPTGPEQVERCAIKGVPSFFVTDILESPRWTVSLAKPTSSLYRPLGMVAGVTGLAILILLTAGEIVSKRLGFRLLEPVSRLTQVMTEILDNGDLERRVSWETRDEMGNLALAFNSMMDKIHTTQTAIQKEKTRQLKREIQKRKEDQERLRKAMVELEEATRAKSDFLANMSHEIRTPMNGILGMAELVMDTRLDDAQKELVATINAEADSLMNILNDILDFSKIEAGKLELSHTPFNLRRLFEDVSATYAVTACKKGLELVSFMPPDIPEHLIGDPGRLRQVLVNLTGNALKFTHAGHVFLGIDQAGETARGLEVTFSIRDTGIGIPPDRQEAIFESFSQADGSTTREYGGTGLGTTISKQLVTMMGGRIWLESVPQKGSTFWFTAVFQKDPQARISALADLPGQGAGVLVATPQKETARVLVSYLKALGCEPVLADTCQGALDLVRLPENERGGIRLVLVDECLAPAEGPDFTCAVGRGDGAPIPVVLLVAMTSAGKKEFNMPNGFPGVMAKPVRLSQLRQVVARLFLSSGQPPRKQAVQESIQSEPDGRDVRILLVEDYPTNQKVALRHLEKVGYQVVLAENGEEAVDLFRKDVFHAILMDIQMPVMDGYEATRQIRKIERNQDKKTDHVNRIPIIAMTAHAIKGYKERCLKAEMDDYVAKPLKRDDLIAVVEKWTGSGRPETPDPSLPPAEASVPSPPLDLPAALYEFDNDETFFKEVLEEFLYSLKTQVSEIKQAVDVRDYGTIASHAHTIQGGSANLTAMDLSAAAAQLEEDAENENLTASSQCLAALEKEIHRLRKFADGL